MLTLLTALVLALQMLVAARARAVPPAPACAATAARLLDEHAPRWAVSPCVVYDTRPAAEAAGAV